MDTPILFLVFNRPDTTSRVFEVIRAAKPTRLYIAADGPRADRPGEVELCSQVRDIVSKVDWQCELSTRYREDNLGCRVAVSDAIDWFFDNEEMGIILEDDCLPGSSFFEFCAELLEKYADDTRVGHIAGTSFFGEIAFRGATESYVFSRFGSVWGWATWRRAWKYYDVSLSMWEEMRKPRWFNSAIPGEHERKSRMEIAEELISGRLNTWDYQWSFARLYNSMLSVVPTRNLVKNLGFDARATHTLNVDVHAPTTITDIEFPLRHPPFVLADSVYETLFEKERFTNNLKSRVLRIIKKMFNSRD